MGTIFMFHIKNGLSVIIKQKGLFWILLRCGGCVEGTGISETSEPSQCFRHVKRKNRPHMPLHLSAFLHLCGEYFAALGGRTETRTGFYPFADCHPGVDFASFHHVH
jgi:hypothetical protein